MIDPIRRVVTGETKDGRAVFTHVEEVEPVMLGKSRWYGVWGWDEPPSFPYLATEPYTHRSAFPAPRGGGLRINVVEFQPGAGVDDGTGAGASIIDLDSASFWKRMMEAQPHGHVLDPKTGMHATESVDIGFVLSGEVCLEQDDGEEVTLRVGDVYVQNGALHAWRNRSSEVCLVAFLLMSTGGRTSERVLREGASIIDDPGGS